MPRIDAVLLHALVVFIAFLGCAAAGTSATTMLYLLGAYVLGAVTDHVSARGRRR